MASRAEIEAKFLAENAAAFKRLERRRKLGLLELQVDERAMFIHLAGERTLRVHAIQALGGIGILGVRACPCLYERQQEGGIDRAAAIAQMPQRLLLTVAQ